VVAELPLEKQGLKDIAEEKYSITDENGNFELLDIPPIQ
jgi:hypothetical protein